MSMMGTFRRVDSITGEVRHEGTARDGRYVVVSEDFDHASGWLVGTYASRLAFEDGEDPTTLTEHGSFTDAMGSAQSIVDHEPEHNHGDDFWHGYTCRTCAWSDHQGRQARGMTHSTCAWCTPQTVVHAFLLTKAEAEMLLASLAVSAREDESDDEFEARDALYARLYEFTR